MSVPGTPDNLNQSLEYAGRVADYLEFAELLALDALHRRESCGGHFREESQTPDGEALRDDEHYSYVAAWEFKGVGQQPELHKEALHVRGSASDAAELQVRRVGIRGLGLGSGIRDAVGFVARIPSPESQIPSRISVRLNLRIWRQAGPTAAGRLVDYAAEARLARHVVPRDARRRQRRADRRGARTRSRSTPTAAKASAACAASSSTACAHGPDRGTTVCQLHMRRFKDGDTITVEPWRAKAFPVVKDLVVDRSAFDRIIAAGGYVVRSTCGGAPDGNAIPIPKDVAEVAMDSAACIGCGACVAACKNASAHLFMSAKISHLRAAAAGTGRNATAASCAMIEQADAEGFGSCSNEGECEAVCPKEIPISNIARDDARVYRALRAPIG